MQARMLKCSLKLNYLHTDSNTIYDLKGFQTDGHKQKQKNLGI